MRNPCQWTNSVNPIKILEASDWNSDELIRNGHYMAIYGRNSLTDGLSAVKSLSSFESRVMGPTS